MRAIRPAASSGFKQTVPVGRGRCHATAVDGRERLLFLWDEERQTGYRELWEGGTTGRFAAAPGGYLLGLPGGVFLRVRGRD